MNSQSHIPGQRLTKETECLAKETTSFAPPKARLTKRSRRTQRLTKELLSNDFPKSSPVNSLRELE